MRKMQYIAFIQLSPQEVNASLGSNHKNISQFLFSNERGGKRKEGKKNQLETYLIPIPSSFKSEFYMTSHKLLRDSPTKSQFYKFER